MSFTSYLGGGDLGDLEVTVEYDYRSGYKGSWNEPPEHPEVEITAVMWRGLDVHGLLSKETIGRLESESFDDVAGEKDQADEDRAEARYFDREAA